MYKDNQKMYTSIMKITNKSGLYSQAQQNKNRFILK